MSTYCFLRNVVDLAAHGQTPYHARFGTPFKGPVIPFGAEVTHKPITAKELEELHQFGLKVLSGIFMGYHQHAGGGWSGDVFVADWSEV